jgi:hypothetical protein
VPDFSVRFSDGTTVQRWTDPPTDALPSRINAAPNRPPLRQVASVGSEVEVSAIVDGDEAPLDGALGGRLFYGWWIEYPTVDPPGLTLPAGQSSVRRFTPALSGHYTYCLRRMDGGGYILHVDAL